MRKVLFAVVGIGIGAGAAYLLLIMPAKPNPRFEPLPADLEIPHVSTRGQFDDGRRLARKPGSFDIVGEVPGLANGIACDEAVIIVVHGFNNSPQKALNRFGVARQGLVANGFDGTVIGFSWDADTQLDPFSATGYHEAKAHTEGNGPLLAKLIENLKRACPGIRVGVIGYSMGARLALESLRHLENSVDAVYLVGAAIDNEEVELDERYGDAIRNRSVRTLNFYSPNDSKLGSFYKVKEADRALGKHDVEHPDRAPKNYHGIDVSNELPAIDDEGRVVPRGEKGANHSGYLGTRNGKGELTDDGVMNLVARDFVLR